MQNFLITLLMAADVFIALIIIALVLVQQSKEGALGSSFGGVGESVFGAEAGGHLAKLTVIFSVLFLSITLALAIIIGHRAKPASLLDKDTTIEKTSPKNATTALADEKKTSSLSKELENTAESGKKEAEKILDEVANVLTKKSSENNSSAQNSNTPENPPENKDQQNPETDKK